MQQQIVSVLLLKSDACGLMLHIEGGCISLDFDPSARRATAVACISGQKEIWMIELRGRREF